MEKASNDNPLISVIVPVYNVEKYLDKCVQSIVEQTYKNLEIILVDDGSPDNCPKMCDDWAKKDKRIKVIHKKNGGLSDARNKGIDKSCGKYITFIDSDDYVEPNYVEFLYKNLKTSNADISMGKQYVRYTKKTINTGTNNKYIVNAHECFDKLLYGEDFDVSAWAKLYSIKLFDGIRFPTGRVFEDSATTFKLIDKSHSIVLESKPIYNYIIRKNSISNDNFSPQKMDLITSTKEMCDHILKKYPDLQKGCDRRMMYAYLSTLTQIAKCKNSKIYKNYKSQIMNYISNNKKRILKDKRVPKRDKISLLASALGFNFYKFAWKLYERSTKRY